VSENNRSPARSLRSLLGFRRRLRARAAARFAWSRIRRVARFLEETAFDLRYGVDTAGIVNPEQQDGAWAHAVHYQAVPSRLFREVMHKLPIDPADCVFVDIGAGKGKAVLLASRMPFRRIIGVELSPRLADAANRNLSGDRGARRSGPAEVVCGDAASFRFPHDPLVVYLFNPFDAQMLVQILSSLYASAVSAPRAIVIAYTDTTAVGRRVVESDARFRLVLDLGHSAIFEVIGHDTALTVAD
jgi:hypothetical protein